MPDSAPLPAAKLMPKVEELWVTTEPFPASRKVHAPGRLHPGISVGMREIDLDPSAGEPPVRAYDTSGPYSDPTIQIDINRGPPKLRKPWILARADVELYEGREVKPEDNGLRRGEASAVSPFDRGRRQVLRAKGGAAVTQLAYGGDKAPERNDQFGCQRHDHCLACATTAIGGAGAIPLPERSHSEMSENVRQVGSCRGGPGRCRLWRALARAVARRSGSEVTAACELLGLDPLHVAHEGRLIAFVAPEDAERAIALLRRHAVTSASAMIGEVTGGSA